MQTKDSIADSGGFCNTGSIFDNRYVCIIMNTYILISAMQFTNMVNCIPALVINCLYQVVSSSPARKDNFAQLLCVHHIP